MKYLIMVIIFDLSYRKLDFDYFNLKFNGFTRFTTIIVIITYEPWNLINFDYITDFSNFIEIGITIGFQTIEIENFIDSSTEAF